MEQLKITMDKNGSTTTYKLDGSMDDAADYSPIVVNDTSVIIIDFSAVKQINSLGIQKWIGFMDRVPQNVRIVFQNCTLKIVNQMNLFPRFMGLNGVTVKSFEIPYFCEKCDSSSVVTVETETAFKDKSAVSAPDRDCSSCQGALEFDGVERKYFSFLNTK